MIWESHDPLVGWDGIFNGNIVQTGMYNWSISCKDIINDDKHSFNGHITVIK